jgi:RNA polymerase sigma-70 factor (ECF subfamily)
VGVGEHLATSIAQRPFDRTIRRAGQDGYTRRVDDLAQQLRQRQRQPPLSPAEHAALHEQLQRALDTARAAFPGVELPAGAFVEHLADRLDPDADPRPAIASLHLSDLYLTCACARGQPGSITAFERTFAAELQRAFTGGKARGLDADDLRQHLRERLFVERDGQPARIASYTGEGPLRAWVRVAATRLRIDSERRRWELQTDLPSEHRMGSLAAAAADDVELAYLKADVRQAFARAFEGATASLSPRERNLLRLNLVHGVSGTALATMYGVHRATAKRWLADAREVLMGRTKEHLQRELGLDATELRSAMDLARSRLELSLQRVLGPAEDEPATG